jgi:hypothetical protein
MHALVVGGTGMLLGVTLKLAGQVDRVSVIGRRPERMNALIVRAGPYANRVNPIVMDYRDTADLKERIRGAIAGYGPVGLAVLWIHSDAPDAFRVVVEAISEHTEKPWRLFHVRGSAARWDMETPRVPSLCLYRQVLLGFVLEEGRSRWLTHQEIAGGVITAIRNDAERSVVGTLEPWDRRPG